MKILVFCPNWVGDAVMATPTLRALRRRFPSAEILGVMRPVISAVLEGLPFLDNWFCWDPRSDRRIERSWTVWHALRRERSDLSVLLSNSLRSATMAWMAGSKRRLGYARDGRSFLLTDRLQPPKQHGKYVPTPAIDYYLELAYFLGSPRESYQLDLTVSPRDQKLADAVWQLNGFSPHDQTVVLNPGAAFGAAKCWPTEYFAELAGRIAKQGSNVLVLCGPKERELAKEIVKRAGSRMVAGLGSAPVSIGLSKACVARCDLLVTTDSGPRHFAAAFDRPVITLFGPTHQQWSETYFPRAVPLQKHVECGPCQLRECPLDHRCMKELTVDETFNAACRALDRQTRRTA